MILRIVRVLIFLIVRVACKIIILNKLVKFYRDKSK